MKITKTACKMDVNHSSSFLIYVCKTYEDAKAVEALLREATYLFASIDWYVSLQVKKVLKDCTVPDFFHDRDYWICSLEHNNGDWDSPIKYELYIVE